MPHRSFSGSDVLSGRFAVSPLWETVVSLRVLQSDSGGVHVAWADRARSRVREAALDLRDLRLLVPPRGHLADVLTPTPRLARPNIDQEFAALDAVPADAVRADLGSLGTPDALAWAALDESALLARFGVAVAALRRYHALVIAPDWPTIRSLTEADIAWRAGVMASEGLSAALSGLHDRLRVDGDRLRVATTCTAPGGTPDGAGLVLVPSVFVTPQVLVLDRAPGPATIAYPPRGVAGLWSRATPTSERLDVALGRTRAAVLARLTRGATTTTDLARDLGLARATAHDHLRALHRSGLAGTHRSGREVWYRLTERGAALTTEDGDGGLRRR